MAPPTLLPVGVEQWPCRVSPDLDAELPALDAVMMLRVQAERMHGAFFPSAREYAIGYGLSEKRAALLKAIPQVFTPENAGELGPYAEAFPEGVEPIVEPEDSIFQPFVDIAAVADVDISDLG